HGFRVLHRAREKKRRPVGGKPGENVQYLLITRTLLAQFLEQLRVKVTEAVVVLAVSWIIVDRVRRAFVRNDLMNRTRKYPTRAERTDRVHAKTCGREQPAMESSYQACRFLIECPVGCGSQSDRWNG